MRTKPKPKLKPGQVVKIKKLSDQYNTYICTGYDRTDLEPEYILHSFNNDKWEYVLMDIGKKKVCIYEDNKPTLKNNKVDAYLSRDDCRLILAIKDAFKAELVKLCEE